MADEPEAPEEAEEPEEPEEEILGYFMDLSLVRRIQVVLQAAGVPSRMAPPTVFDPSLPLPVGGELRVRAEDRIRARSALSRERLLDDGIDE